ncbi:peptidoglycan-binding protein [Ruegeria sp. HKCCSP335]|uniref:peptidoglycan-binding protein n=1 Tax=Ruegeria sp. HKCCSP335 TaxID=2794833 RepID=UPI001AE8F416|nr:peptidoglycan-binding protein [Ruegeria sp. HKCCSP335]
MNFPRLTGTLFLSGLFGFLGHAISAQEKYDFHTINSFDLFDYVSFAVSLGYYDLGKDYERNSRIDHVADYLTRNLHQSKWQAMSAFEQRQFRKDLIQSVEERAARFPKTMEFDVSFQVGLGKDYWFGDETSLDLGTLGNFWVCIPYEVTDATTANGANGGFPSVQIVWPSQFSGGQTRRCQNTADGVMRAFSGRLPMPDDSFAEAMFESGGVATLETKCSLSNGNIVHARQQGSGSIFAGLSQSGSGQGFGCINNGEVSIRSGENALTFVTRGGSQLFGRSEDVTALLPHFEALTDSIAAGDHSALNSHIDKTVPNADATWRQNFPSASVYVVARRPNGEEQSRAIMCLKGLPGRPAYLACGEIDAEWQHDTSVSKSNEVAVGQTKSEASSTPISTPEDAQSILDEAEKLYQGTETSPDELLQVKRLLDQIAFEHPSTDLAVSILLQEQVGGIDVAELDSLLEQQEKKLQEPNSISDCIGNSLPEQPTQDLRAVIQVDQSGAVEGFPELVNTTKIDAATRKFFSDFVSALDSCGPFSPSFANKSVTAEVSVDGIVSLTVDTSEPQNEATAENATQTPPESNRAVTFAPATKESEAALSLDSGAIRDIQARLLVLGFDPNGVDGKVGKGTRSAIARWQSSLSVDPTSFLNDQFLDELKVRSNEKLAVWLNDPDNQRLYNPPPPIAIGPGNVTGNWRYVTNCGPNSRVGAIKINGVFNIKHAGGNRYTGSLRNSQGLNARVNATLNGRSISAVANFGLLLGKTTLNARIADYKLTMSGRDSNRCSFYASKG